MYLQFFGFSSPPFSDTPDVRLFWEDHCSQLIFKALLQGLAAGLTLQLVIAEPGLGKSVLCRRLLNSLRSHRSRYDVVFMPFPNLSVSGLLSTGMACIESGRRRVLIIDEAQSLSDQSLRELTGTLKQSGNGEHELQMVFFAQPELDQRLTPHEVEITESLAFKRYDLHPLTGHQTAAYINNRLTLTGISPETVAPPEIAALAFRLTGGVPRLINTLMRKSLLFAFEEQRQMLSPEHLRRAASTTAASVPDSAY